MEEQLMAHFAEIDSDNKVLRVLVVPDEQEHRGQEFLCDELKLGGTWIQTSYNTHHGKHKTGKRLLRMNYASRGYSYDPQRDAFIPPKKFPSWILNEETCDWVNPVPYPKDGKRYRWDEPTVSWVEVT